MIYQIDVLKLVYEVKLDFKHLLVVPHHHIWLP